MLSDYTKMTLSLTCHHCTVHNRIELSYWCDQIQRGTKVDFV